MRKRIKKERGKKEKNKVTIVTAGIEWVKNVYIDSKLM